MNISRNNYEEYFVLYMDNELGNADRRQVEAFVQQHPDLKEELDSLLQYKLVPDTAIIFERKEELMIPLVNGIEMHEGITLSNFEEWLVLYTDNELTTGQNKMVEEFILAHPSVKTELDLLQRAKLQPEEIVFADKSSLYRTEKVRRIPVRVWRIAAAAVLLIGIGLSTAIIINNKKAADGADIAKDTQPGLKTDPVIAPVVVNSQENTTVKETALSNPVNQSSPVRKQAVNNNNNLVIKEKNNTVKNPAPVIIQQQPIKEEPVLVNNKPSNDLPVPSNNSNKAIAKENVKENQEQELLKNAVVTIDPPPSSDKMMHASYTPDELDQPDGKKNKNRGLFRKIARTFEKRTSIDPTDDNKLLVAGLAIKLK